MTLGKTRRKSGFSLMEFLIVIGIIAVLAVIIVPATVGIINKSNQENDKVLAATYTEYMQKFATEKAGSADFYSTVYNDGVGSEYDILESNSGLGSFPGITQLNEKINTSNEEDIWKLIRKEACIAIKAYGEVELADNDKYFIGKPIDEEMAFVYYYLTGKVEIKNVSDMKKITIQEVNDGAIDTEDYWVYLDREGGSGKAIGQPNAQRDFYVQIYQYGVENGGLFNEPINGVTVSVNFADKTGKDCIKSAITSTNGLLVFRDMPETITITAKKEDGSAIAYPDATYYPSSTTGPYYPQQRLPLDEFWPVNTVNTVTSLTGNSPTNPFVIYLKMGTLGSLEFLETVKTYEYVSGSSITHKTENVQIMLPNDFTTTFEKTDSSIAGRNETYNSSTPGYNPLELLGVDADGIFKFLMYGDYDMNITNNTNNEKTGNPNFLPYDEKITSDVYGIYNTANPGNYPMNSSPYPYPVVLQRTDTLVQGTLISENAKQPLHDTHKVLLPSTNYDTVSSVAGNISLQSRVCVAVTKSNGTVKKYYSDYLSPKGTTDDGSFIYDFEVHLNNEHSGDNFVIFIETKYGNTDTNLSMKRLNLSKWPNTLKADGTTYRFSTKVNSTTFSNDTKIDLQADIPQTNFEISIYHTENSIRVPLTYTATIERLGYNTTSNNVTKFSASAFAFDSNGIAKFKNVYKGFYKLKIHYNEAYGDKNAEYIIFVDEGNYVINDNTISVPSLELIKYEIYCKPVTANGNDISTDNDILSNKNGYNEIQFYVIVDGVALQQSSTKTTNGYYQVDYTSPSKNMVKITFYHIPTTQYLVVSQKVDCFNNSSIKFVDSDISDNGIISDAKKEEIRKHTVSNTSNMLVIKSMVSGDYNTTFNIYRKETLSSTDTDHPSGAWEWQVSGSQHYELCKHCYLERSKSSHFYETNIKTGEVKEKSPAYYAYDSAKVGKTDAINNGHYKHCTVCNKYNEKQNSCSGGSWTYYYNSYIDSSSKKMTDGHTAYLLTGNSDKSTTASEGDTGYHFKYCSLCHQKYTKAQHNIEKNTKSTQSCTAAREVDIWCKDNCGYTRTDYDDPLGHIPTDGTKEYFLGWMDYCYGVRYPVYCSRPGCGAHLSDVNDYTAGGYHSKIGGHSNKKSYTGAAETASGTINGTTYTVIQVHPYGKTPEGNDNNHRWFSPNMGHIRSGNSYGLGSLHGSSSPNNFGCVFTSGRMPTSPATFDNIQGASMSYGGSYGSWQCDKDFTIPATGSRIYYCRAVWGAIEGISTTD